MWYLVLSRRVATNEAREERTPAHRDWLDAQHRAGKLLFSGMITDPSGQTHGAYVVLAGSRSEAERIANEDPYHAHGDRKAEVWEWNAHRALRLDGPTIEDLESMARGSP
jgi:uncharacterized protein YciI